MKKQGILILAFIGMLIILAAFIMPEDVTRSDPPQNIPDSVWAVFEKTCYDCHSNEGNGMAKAKLNFDKWESYSESKQSSKAVDCCDEIRNGKMPPKKYLKNNPDGAPTETEITRTCNWANPK